MRRANPFFIVGCPRSGTTLLSLMVDSHPRLAVPPESHFIVPLAPPRFLGRMLRPATVDDVLPYLAARDWDVDPDVVRAAVTRTAPRSYAELVSAVFEAYAAAHGKERWGDKTPRYVDYLPTLVRLFPEARFIHLIRDGREVAASLAERRWGPSNAVLAAWVWRRSITRARRAGRRLGQRYLELRLEDLVDDPAGRLRQLCEFLDEEYSPQMLDYASGDRARATAAKAGRRLVEPPTAGLRDWRAGLGGLQQRGVEAVCSDLLEGLRYPSAHSSQAARAYARAVLLSRLPLMALAGGAVAAGRLGRLRLRQTPAARHGGPAEPLRIALFADQFPELSETFIAEEVRALRELGHDVRVEARGAASTPNHPAAAGVPVSIAAEDGVPRKVRDLTWLVSRHPLRCAADLAARRRWRREEAVRPLRNLAPTVRRVAEEKAGHLHVHFAAGAALDAMRTARLVGLPYSVMAHAYDIYREPANLREKLRRAAFAATASDFTVSHLRESAGPGARVEKLVLGVDPDRFQRRTAPQRRRVVAAVGRLVEKKGFTHLLDAVSLLEDSTPVDRVVLLGAGPLERGLRAQAAELGIAEKVEWLGARRPDEVRDLLENATLLAMPCVVARDGDRDSSPVAVKEALAMEVPVVASDGFGIDEVVRPEWGRLVPPGDARALADALRHVLELTDEERAAMGRRGREWVEERWNLHREAAKLADLIRAEAAPQRTPAPAGDRVAA